MWQAWDSKHTWSLVTLFLLVQNVETVNRVTSDQCTHLTSFRDTPAAFLHQLCQNHSWSGPGQTTGSPDFFLSTPVFLSTLLQVTPCHSKFDQTGLLNFQPVPLATVGFWKSRAASFHCSAPWCAWNPSHCPWWGHNWQTLTLSEMHPNTGNTSSLGSVANHLC